MSEPFLYLAARKESSCDDEDEEFQRPVKANGRYVDPWGTVSFPSSYDVFKWRFLEKSERGIGGTLRHLYRFNVEELDQNLPVLHPVRSALESPPEGSIQVTWLGHATVLVQMDGLNILTDPVFSTHCGPTWLLSLKRYRPIPCSVSDLPEIDAVCISHNHYDHLDYNTVTNLNHRFGDKLHWFVPMGLARWMFQSGCNNVTELEWWDGKEHPKRGIDGISTKFIFTPTQHWCRRSLGDRNKVLWGSWTIIGPHHKFFFAGDTGYCKGFKQIGRKFGPFDFAAIPIGAYKPRWFLKFQHVDPVEAVCIHEDIRSCSSLGIHWGTFPTGYEHYLDPPKDLLAALEDKGISHSSFFTLKHGETRVIEQIEPANNS